MPHPRAPLGRSAPLAFAATLTHLALTGSVAAEPVGMCRFNERAKACTCSFVSIDLPLSFGEAAELVLLFDAIEPGPHQERLIVELFRQCAHDAAGRRTKDYLLSERRDATSAKVGGDDGTRP